MTKKAVDKLSFSLISILKICVLPHPCLSMSQFLLLQVTYSQSLTNVQGCNLFLFKKKPDKFSFFIFFILQAGNIYSDLQVDRSIRLWRKQTLSLKKKKYKEIKKKRCLLRNGKKIRKTILFRDLVPSGGSFEIVDLKSIALENRK